VIDSKKKIGSPTKVTSTRNFELEPDEKEVKYYQDNLDNSDVSATIHAENVVSEANQDQDNHWGRSIWVKEKKFIIGLLDTFDPSELENLEFQISTCEQGGRKLVIKNMEVRC